MIVDSHCHLPLTLLAPGASPDIGPFLERKARERIDHAVLHHVIVQLPPAAGTVLERTKRWNSIALGFHAEHPERMSIMTGVDPLGGDEELEEARAALEAGAVGLTLTAPEDGRLLGDPETEEFWSFAAELGVPVSVHPPVGPVGSGDPRLAEFAGRAVRVALNVGSIIFGGVLDRHPSLRIIATAGGGGITALIGRLDAAYEIYRTTGGSTAASAAGTREADDEPTPRQAPSAYLDRIYLDTLLYSEAGLRSAVELFGPGRMLFATDWPPVEVPTTAALAPIQQLLISDEERQGILGENAAKLFGIE